jgi:hypothetical protein
MISLCTSCAQKQAEALFRRFNHRPTNSRSHDTRLLDYGSVTRQDAPQSMIASTPTPTNPVRFLVDRASWSSHSSSGFDRYFMSLSRLQDFALFIRWLVNVGAKVVIHTERRAELD